MDIDLSKTLQELDGEDWGEPAYRSHLIVSCHRIHRTRLRDLTAEDLRTMIGQELCLPYLLPLALERLAVDPLIAGDLYPGDLLRSVLRLPAAVWREQAGPHARMRQVMAKYAERAAQQDAAWQKTIGPDIEEARAAFASFWGRA